MNKSYSLERGFRCWVAMNNFSYELDINGINLFFLWKCRITERERRDMDRKSNFPSLDSPTAQMPASMGLSQLKAKNPEFLPSVQCGFRGPKTCVVPPRFISR